MPRSRRVRCKKWRPRTSSQSSVEIQVTEKVIASESSPAKVQVKDTVAAASNLLPLVRPIPGFLRLIQTIGAQGSPSLHGELFNMKQLCFYLTEYVRHRQLWDPLNPLVVNCGTDPLGQVFQVDRFTLHDVIGLIKRSVVPLAEIETQEWTKSTEVSHSCDTNTEQERDVPHTITSAVGDALPSTPLRGADNREAIVSPSTSLAKSDTGEDVADGDCGKTRRRRKRKRTADKDKNTSSASSDGPAKVCRRHRQPSFSLTYSSDMGNSTHPWQLQVEMYDSGDSEVLSIQSKVTAVVRSSSDDMWFLDESDEGVSFEVSSSFEAVKAADPPFSLEYEVESDTEVQVGFGEDSQDTESESQIENILVVCDESDIAFWADSESDDDEDRSDEDLAEADKWRCSECDTMNNPLHRYCDRCWNLHPGWLPDQLLSLQRNGCSCTSWSQDHKNHIASARTQAWAEHVNKSLSRRDVTESATLQGSETATLQGSETATLQGSETATLQGSESESTAAGACQYVNVVSETLQPCVDGDVSDNRNSGDDVSQHPCRSAIPLNNPPSHANVTTPTLPFTLSANHDNSDANTSDTSSIPHNVYSGVKLTRSDTMPIMDCLARRNQLNSIGDSMRTSSVISADSADTDILMSSVARDDSGIGLGLGSHIPDCDDLAMADIYKNGPRDISTPTTPKQFTIESCVSSDSLRSGVDVNCPKDTDTSASNLVQSSDMCVICLTRPKEASIIHGNTGHQVCCYICAKRLQHRRMSCPVCRRPISGVIRNYRL